MRAVAATSPGERRPSAGARAAADLLIDGERLSALLGRPVRATRLRFKPGLSTTAVLVDPAGTVPPGWIQVSHPGHQDKVRNALRRAHDRDLHVHVLRTGDLTVAHGDLDSDPRLQRGLDGLRSVHPSVRQAVAAGRLEVLRYNPQRRVVLRRALAHGEALVLRVTADQQHDVRARLAAYAAAGVPVVEPVSARGLHRTRRVTVWPWFGRGDLAHLSAVRTDGSAGAPTAGGPTRVDAAEVTAAAAAAGEALARLHRADLRHPRVPDPVPALQSLVEELAALDTSGAHRVGLLARRCGDRIAATDWATGPVHGDFSADQVLVGRAGEDTVRLTDFDRAGHGPLLADLGSFAAAELLAVTDGAAGPTAWDVAALPLTNHLLAGYAHTGEGGAGGGRAGALAADDPALRTWVARALLARVSEPFRAGDPDWVEGIHRRLDQVELVLR
ncbi:phosphotransferase [Ornithinimicrobium cavernae]|uniref:phosphotransferase n=1 Tax=Ornithinimicrobium cavernae TaxID=2666047 RepID=UPI001379ED14|nr:phosphotransferase [Ornithinimicrobium cavernae]